MLVGEGVYGLRFIAATTSPPFWGAEVVAGIGLLLVLAVWRLEGSRQIGTAVVIAFATSATFVALYGQGLRVIP